MRFDDQAGRGIGKLGLLQCLKEVEFTPEQIKGICCVERERFVERD